MSTEDDDVFFQMDDVGGDEFAEVTAAPRGLLVRPRFHTGQRRQWVHGHTVSDHRAQDGPASNTA